MLIGVAAIVVLVLMMAVGMLALSGVIARALT
jgi:hypothetical protein